MTKKNEVKKHSSAIHTSGKLSLLERKLSNVLLHNAYDELLNRRTHSINIYVLGELSGFNSKNIDAIKDSLRKLQSVQIEWDILDENGKKEWGVSSLLASVKFNEAVCTYEYSQALSEKLSEPKYYGIINLEIQKNIKSSYSLTIYEICSRYKGILKKRTTCYTPWYSLEQFSKLLGVDDSIYYSAFKELNRKIIKPSMNEINGSLKKYIGTDIDIQPEYKKVNKSVTDIRFMIKPNRQTPLQLEHEGCEGIRKTEVYLNLCELGLSDKGAMHVIQTNETSYINEKIELTRQAIEKCSIISSVGGYLKKSLDDDYQPAKVPVSKKSEDDKKKHIEEKTKKEHEKKINKISKDVREEYIASLTEGQKESLLVSVRDGKSPTIKRLIKSLSSPHIASEVNSQIPGFEEALEKRMLSELPVAENASPIPSYEERPRTLLDLSQGLAHTADK